MNVVISLKTGEIREIVDALSVEVDKDKLTCLGSTEFHSISLNTIRSVRIVDKMDLHDLFNYLTKVENGVLSDDVLPNSLKSGVCDWNARNKTSLNPTNTVKAYFEWVEKR